MMLQYIASSTMYCGITEEEARTAASTSREEARRCTEASHPWRYTGASPPRRCTVASPRRRRRTAASPLRRCTTASQRRRQCTVASPRKRRSTVASPRRRRCCCSPLPSRNVVRHRQGGEGRVRLEDAGEHCVHCERLKDVHDGCREVRARGHLSCTSSGRTRLPFVFRGRPH